MGINIVNQTNEQECGVCVLTALHNHYYDSVVQKEQALEQSHITEDGMTIFDFESLGSTLGLECESYEVKFSEFRSLKINNYFVLLLATNNGATNHYVIARKKKKYIEIYDSCSLKMNKISYEQLRQIFLNVVILVKKRPNKIFTKVFGKATTLLMFDLKFVLLNILLSVLILGVSVASASFLNYVIELAINESSVNNLITICFVFVFFYFANDILSYISSLYMSRHIKDYFVLFTNKILSSLEIKNSNFLNKVDKNWIFKVDECVYNISNFTIIEINKFITSIIFTVTCICVIGVVQYYLLIFVGVYLLIEFIFFLFEYRKKNEVFLEIVRSENANAQHYKNLINSLNNELWINKRRSIISKIKNNYSSIYKNYSDVILFKNNTSLFKSILKSFIEICLIGLMAYLIIRTDKLSVGKLTFVISAFALYKNSCADLFNYFIAKVEFNVYWQVYKDLVGVGNVLDTKFFHMKESIKSITFDLNEKKRELYTNSKFNRLTESVCQLIKNSKHIFINKKETEINKQLIESIVVVDQFALANCDMLIKQIETNPVGYSQYIKYFQLDLNKSNQTFYHQIIINLLCLLNERNKIIFVDDVLQYIRKDDLVVTKQLLTKIKKHNYVFVCGKEEYD